ncbi:MAG: hypothetical protein ACYDA6_11960, partial [Solirubrobacteraceae bacterium]
MGHARSEQAQVVPARRPQRAAGTGGAEPRAQAPSAPWRAALSLMDADLARRGAAERTRHAYGVDCERFARWAGARDMAPPEVSLRALRLY